MTKKIVRAGNPINVEKIGCASGKDFFMKNIEHSPKKPVMKEEMIRAGKHVEVEKLGQASKKNDNIHVKLKDIKIIFQNDKGFITDFPHFEENQKYYANNRQKISKKYGGKIILVHNKKIYSVFSNFDEFSEKIGKIHDEIRNRSFITHVPKNNQTFII